MKNGIFGGGRRPQSGGRRRGGARIWELLGQELVNYFLAGLPALFTATLYGAGVYLAFQTGSLLAVLLAGLLLGLPVGLFLSALTDCILRTLRDRPGSWRENYKKALRLNALQSLLFGGVFGLILAGQVFSLLAGLHIAVTLLCLALLTAVALYVFPQIALMQLGSLDILRNAAVLLLAHPLRSLEALLLAAVCAFVLWLFFPISLFIWAIGGLWFPGLLILQTLSGVLEESFHAEETISERENSSRF